MVVRNKERRRKVAKEGYDRLHKLCLDHYGAKCAICSSTSLLTIDHINGEGNALNGDKLWRYLKANHFPPGFRTLCNRCNRLDGSLRKHPILNVRGIDDIISLLQERKSGGYAPISHTKREVVL